MTAPAGHAAAPEQSCPDTVVLAARGSDQNEDYGEYFGPQSYSEYSEPSNGYEGPNFTALFHQVEQRHLGTMDDVYVLALDDKAYPANMDLPPLAEEGENIGPIELVQRAVGIVQQDVYLFSGSVNENIAYGRENATPEEIRTAARLAGADEFISRLPDGYDTYVGERGVKLSGGQKQRISIARVFLKNPPVLILDEATSALDNESEMLVSESLERLAHGRTTLTIAHRLTTVRDYDRIVVLGKNGIEEMGTHGELLEKRGTYYRLWNKIPIN